MAGIEQSEIADLLAKSQALTPTEGTNVPLGQKPPISPEEAVALMDAQDAKTINSAGDVVPAVVEEPEVILEKEEAEIKVEAPDLTGKTIKEQIELLQEHEKALEALANPMASVEKKAEEAGIDVEGYRKEYIANGELTKESLDALEKAGFDKVAVDAYIESKNNSAQKLVDTAITNTCGGQEGFNKMAEWMGETLSDAELDKYNAGIKTENYELYLENMYMRYTQANPTPARLVRGNGGAVKTTSDSGAFKSDGEMILAMSDPRYKNDAQYKRDVIKRVSLMK